MNPGSLDRKVSLSRSVVAGADGFGYRETAEQEVFQAWARMLPQRGDEAYESDRERAERPVRWRLRYDRRIDVGQTIVYDGRTYEIRSLQEVERRKLYLVESVEYIATPEPVAVQGPVLAEDGTTILLETGEIMLNDRGDLFPGEYVVNPEIAAMETDAILDELGHPLLSEDGLILIPDVGLIPDGNPYSVADYAA